MSGNSWSFPYAKRIVGGMLILSGAFLLLEHLFTFGGFDIELFGHEYLGIAMILSAFLMNVKREQWKSFIEAVKKREWRKVLDERERRKTRKKV